MPGDEDERDRRDGDRELDDTGERHEAEGEKDGVPPDLRRARHCERAYRARSRRPALRSGAPDRVRSRATMAANVTGSSGKPG